MLRNFAASIDKIDEWIGEVISWLVLLLVLVTVYDVLMRYLFQAGSVALQEIEVHLFATNFMLTAGWALLREGHVRVDLLYSRLGTRKRAWVNLLGALFLCIPYCVVVIWAAFPFVIDSWSIQEGSPDPGGLGARYLLKTVIPLAFALILLQALSQAIKNLLIVIEKKKRR
jgi:TRAP-type mannitol/chloroaromatic compound transport system permease small subunit